METFVVRIWAPADPAEDPVVTGRVQGRLEHVTSGRRGSFRGLDELGRLIDEELRRKSVDEFDARAHASHRSTAAIELDAEPTGKREE